MKTKFFTLLFAILASSTLSYAAIVNGECGDNLTWSLNTKDSTLTIEGTGEMTIHPWSEYSSYIKHVNLPNGLTNISGSAFFGCRVLASIEIPNSVISIGESAFSLCKSLTSIEIPNSVTSIGVAAFSDCSNLTSVKISNSITSIDGYEFAGCYNLISIEIPNSVISIGERAFFNCASLTSVTIPNSVTTIGESAFGDCRNLTSVAIGNSITSIEREAFYYCNITSLTILATTPPSEGISWGIDNTNCTLYVPAEAIDTYANTIWWEDFKLIKAIEGNLFTVDFVDWNEQVIARRFVENGQAAVAPTAPTREGYTFIGWDKDFSNITEDLTITALYEEIPTTNYTLLFTNGTDDSEIASQSIEFALPTAPLIDGFTFLKWVVVAGDLTETIEIQAVYTANTPTSAPEVYTNPKKPGQKLIKNGNVYILTEEKTYMVSGQVVK